MRRPSFARPGLALALVLGLVALVPRADAQLDEKLAAKGLAEAVKISTATYKAEVSESLLFFALQLEQAFQDVALDGYQPDDLVAIGAALDNLLMGLREDFAEAVAVLGEKASLALADASGGVPLEGQLPVAFRVGAGKTVDQAVAKLAKLQGKVFKLVDKVGRKLVKIVAKGTGTVIVFAVEPASRAPVLAFDEERAFPTWDVELSIDMLVCAYDESFPGVHRIVAAGFASDVEADVVVERLDLTGEVVESFVVTPNLGRWFGNIDRDRPGHVVIRVRQGAAAVTRALWVP